jgi:hypothetical protein
MMPRYVFQIDGKRHVFEGPDQQTTARYAQQWAASRHAEAPVTFVGTAKAFGSGMLNAFVGLGNMAKLAGSSDIESLANQADSWLATHLGGQTPQQAAAGLRRAETARMMFSGPTSTEAQRGVGLYYTPRNSVEQFADTAGGSVPNAFVPGAGEAGLIRGGLAAATRVLSPAIGATVAPRIVQAAGGGQTAQNVARVLGGLVGGASSHAFEAVPRMAKAPLSLNTPEVTPEYRPISVLDQPGTVEEPPETVRRPNMVTPQKEVTPLQGATPPSGATPDEGGTASATVTPPNGSGVLPFDRSLRSSEPLKTPSNSDVGIAPANAEVVDFAKRRTAAGPPKPTNIQAAAAAGQQSGQAADAEEGLPVSEAAQEPLAAGATALQKLIGAAAAITNRTPGMSPAARALLEERIPLTLGQRLGGLPKKIEDAVAATVPITGGAIDSARAGSSEGFNRATANRVLAHIEETTPARVPVGDEMVAYVGKRLAAEKNLANSMYNNMRADPQFDKDIHDTLFDAESTLSPSGFSKFLKVVQDAVGSSDVWSEGQEPFHGMRAQFDQLADQYRDVRDLNGNEFSPHFDALSNATGEFLDRKDRQISQVLRGVDEANARYVRMRAAAASPASPGGVFTPATLKAVVSSPNRDMTNGASAEADAELQRLASDADQVIGSAPAVRGRILRAAVATAGAAAAPTHPAVVGAAGTGLSLASIPYLAVGRGVGQVFQDVDPAATLTLPLRTNAFRSAPSIVGPPVSISLPPTGPNLDDNDQSQ